MSHEGRVQHELNFIETCIALDMIDETAARSLSDSIGQDGSIIAQTVLQRGLLTQADVDIVHSLQRPTEVVPGYKIIDLVGRGGMGVVYRAEQLDLGKIVALKTILIGNVHDPTVAARFEREAKSLARLQHPNIVQALNFGRHEGRYYFAMEFVPGATCEQALDDVGVMQPERVWSIVRQVASGLMHALGQNLIHRDIKPANLLLLPPPEGSVDQTEVVKIADFGLAMFADQSADQNKLTTGDKMMGSPAYMALEQFSAGNVDFRSDMYALGATAWHLLFGKPPFQATTVGALYQQKSQRLVVDQTAFPVALPDEQMQLLVKLLDPAPGRRPDSYQRLIESIDAFDLDRSSTSARAPEATQVVMAPAITAITAVTVQPVTVQPVTVQPVTVQPVTVQPVTGKEPGPIDHRVSTKVVNRLTAPSSEMAETIDSSSSFGSFEKSDQPGTTNKRRFITIAVAVSVAATLAILGWMAFYSPIRGPRTYTRVAGTTPLFDGLTLSGWDVGGSMVGAWNTVEAPDASTAIACTTRKGALTRRFEETTNPRINLFVWLQPESGPVEIDFAFDADSPTDVRGTLRMTGASNQLGEKNSDFGDLTVVAQVDALPTVHDRYHVIHIERQVSDWYVFLEEELIGTLPIERVGDGNAIRLVVRSGSGSSAIQSNAFFADVQLFALRNETETETVAETEAKAVAED